MSNIAFNFIQIISFYWFSLGHDPVETKLPVSEQNIFLLEPADIQDFLSVSFAAEPP